MKKATMWEHTVDGRNPANRLGCIKPCNRSGKTTYQLVLDFFHQPYLQGHFRGVKFHPISNDRWGPLPSTISSI